MTSPNSPCRIFEIFPEYTQIFFIDVETSGLSVSENRIIELAAVCLYRTDVKETEETELDVFIRLPSGEKIPAEVENLTGITDDRLADEGISEEAAVSEFLKMFRPEKTLLIAHNAQFDLAFLLKMIERHDQKIPVPFDVLDTFTIVKDRKEYPHSFEETAKYYGISDIENAHRAITDVRALCRIAERMQEERDDLKEYINLIGAHRVHGIWGDKIEGVTYVIQLLGPKKKRLPDFLKEGKRIYAPEKIKETRPLKFKE